MLLQTEKPVADIAKECGFTTVNYFNRIFRNIMGVSPGEYRNARKIC
jgi:AraC-like DNA-binding protein